MCRTLTASTSPHKALPNFCNGMYKHRVENRQSVSKYTLLKPIADKIVSSIMAWVNRTSRDNCPGGLQEKTRTSAHLGPGCYETLPSNRMRPNATAFGCGEKLERGTNAGFTKGLTMITPGPGAYVIDNLTRWESPTPSKTLTSVFQSKSQRIDDSKLRRGYSTPGPGSYSDRDFFAHRFKGHTSSGNSFVKTPPSNNKIRWMRLPTAPSIPTVLQSFGYEQENGRLVRHEPVKVGHTGCGKDTLGPGEYEPMKGLKSISNTRTTDFSKGKVMRFIESELRAKAGVPGPGEYKSLGDAAALKDPARSSAVFKSALSREQATLVTATKSVPGPGAYFLNQTNGISVETKPEHLQFFGSTSTRFDTTRREGLGPGPGAYHHEQSGTVQQQRFIPDGKTAPFSSKKERFEVMKSSKQSLVSPGSYEVPSTMSELLNKVTSRVSTFGSTTKRFDTISSGCEHETLESQLERDMKASEANRQQQRHSKKKQQKPKASFMFASSTRRMDRKVTGPSPGDYEVQRSWDASGARGAFKSGINRMKSQSDLVTSVPGPGSYSTERLEQKPQHKPQPNVFYAAEPRFKEKMLKMPTLGPGYYNTDTIESSWNRPTHNISIATEMELAMIS
ncbi:Sperm-tail PG-rich repeat [Plasmopara halstedii]|uniref:Sperm-tail PG-rich repeat n=1 Tax=Plasmopara halstedii TaxID=4781 RepID=A0A0N7L5S2_PLAHL|nr:Sperm-tail PG-rich repeat [Plasmopara halstedii]CEG42267.1 Sperm-tail PG-rich repeat [Plasmopara halstedii]|eukprot:XP_024578636.1 Sperm-tail PG-rich repeat [Plasmopara halstedii]